MKSTNRLLSLLIFVTLFVMGEVWGSGSNAWSGKSHTSGGASSGSGNSGRPSARGSSPGRTQASDQNQSSQRPSSQTSAWHQTPSAASPGHRPQSQTKDDFPPLPRSRQQNDAENRHLQTQTTPASPSITSTSVPNHPATTTHSGIQTSSVSDGTCVDDKSPAEKCFDYFILAMLWSPGYAYKQSLMNHIAREMVGRWVIHGLWPSMYSKDAIIPPQCNRSDIFYNTPRVLGKGMQHKLSQFWCPVLETGFKAHDDLWKHEFIKHGNCATRSIAIRNVQGYFTKTLELFENLQIDTKLSTARYNRGATLKLRDIIKIIEERVHAKVKVAYVADATKKDEESENINYLAEVFVCYNTGLTAIIDCPNSWLPDFVLDKRVMYLDRTTGQQEQESRRCNI